MIWQGPTPNALSIKVLYANHTLKNRMIHLLASCTWTFAEPELAAVSKIYCVQWQDAVKG